MRNYCFVILLFLGTLCCTSCSKSTPKRSFKTSLDSASYSLGMLFASKIPQNLKNNHVDTIAMQLFLQGLNDYFNTQDSTAFTEKQTQEILNNYIEQLQATSNSYFLEQNKHLQAEGEAFLTQNKKNPNVFELKKGLQYQVFYSGWSPTKPKLTDTLLVHFKMMDLQQNVLFDSRTKNQDPVRLTLDSTIQAWQLVLPMMKMGSRVRIFTSADFAYGTAPKPNDLIKPYQALIFDIDFVRIVQKK
ncbi:MAG: FKBP-type peptidyl-prolyl cis-trans isomerase [Bacteroidales bacterium]|nr:FKBP-type peptidyl-prolyl cis-trans isomerase [Bacteroidales bacterium]